MKPTPASVHTPVRGRPRASDRCFAFRLGWPIFAWTAGALVALLAAAAAGPGLGFLIAAPSLWRRASLDAVDGQPAFAITMTDLDSRGEMGFAYDASGELSLRDDRRSPQWHRRTARAPLGPCTAADRIVGSYYVWRTDYGCLPESLRP